MNIKFSTVVDRPFDVVQANFGKDLFHYLAPPRFVATSEAYEGDEIGDHIIMNFHFPVKGKWISEITSRQETEKLYQFEDKGIELPLGITTWHHKHKVEKLDEIQTRITDDMNFTVVNPLLKIPVFFGLYFGFAPRKWKYRSYFSKCKE